MAKKRGHMGKTKHITSSNKSAGKATKAKRKVRPMDGVDAGTKGTGSAG